MTKEILAIPMLLCPYDHSRKLVLTWDSSDEGIGALLCHVGDDEQLELIADVASENRNTEGPKMSHAQPPTRKTPLEFAIKTYYGIIFGGQASIRILRIM
ncbi:hypothetical protein GJ496_003511 [Pomphorhynchus laevis]|nr:hypothetical protein GJ496_003511 [Pomphorhynchus laevis]